MRRSARKQLWSRRTAGTLLLALCVSGVSMAVALAGEPGAGFRIVTHPESVAVSVDREFIADAFLKKTTRWPGDEAIYPVDQGADTAVRQRFSSQILRRSVFAVRSYWQQRIFAGRGVPPPEVESDEAVLRYVRSRRGAVGYVSDAADVHSVKVLTLR